MGKQDTPKLRLCTQWLPHLETTLLGSVPLLTVALLVTTATATLLPSVGHAATCYVDERGRIVTRRRPGFRPIECPVNEAPAAPEAPTVTPAPTIEPGAVDAPAVTPAPQSPVDEPVQTPLPAPDTPSAEPQAPEQRNENLYRLPGRRLTREERDSGVVTRQGRQRNPVSPIPAVTAADHREGILMSDRWRIVDKLGYTMSLLDPYNRNPLKADRPVHDDWFYNVAVISDSILEQRDLPTPVGGSSTLNPNSIDVFGGTGQTMLVQNIATELVYYKGDTVFRPPDHEFRLTVAFNLNDTTIEELQGINADPAEGENRFDNHLGVQALFYDRHLRNVSDRFDFDSLRVGIQPFSSDFRGFLFQDNQFGVRLFGIRDNNFWQYNLAWFRRIEKDTNSGLNDISQPLRNDDVFIANLYRQDWPVKGFISQVTALYNTNKEGDEAHYDQNDFIQRPSSLGREAFRDYDVLYLGYNGDGHFGRWNLTGSFYQAFGTESTGTFVDQETTINASFAAIELSRDYSWIRPRISFMYGSGDSDPFDDVATGFDSIFENPQFAGGDTSFWNRQAVPLVAGGRVALSGRNAFLNSLRSSKEEGQSNFTNPGLVLAGVGVDMDILPTLRLSLNFNSLYFDTTEVLEVARNQPNIDTAIGQDVSASLTYRPWMSQNIVLRGSYATLLPAAGFDDLYPDEVSGYFLFNATVNY